MASLVKEYTKEKLTGQIFTPFFIVEKILDDVNYNSANILGKRILDPSCGDGRFLLKIAKRIIKYSPKSQLIANLEKIYGWDIDKIAIDIAINKLNELITQYDIKVNWNIKVLNSLRKGIAQQDIFFSSNDTEKFDYIVGNPPYIRIQHLAPKERKLIQQNYLFCKSGSTDIYIAFYELAKNLLKNTGICGYITPNTFFHTDTAKELRNFFANNHSLVQVTNYSHIQLFNDATTYSAIVIFNKNKNKNFKFQYAKTKNEFDERIIDFNEIKNTKFWQLSVKKQKNQKGKRLGDIADIHVGITTLSDKIYIMPIVDENENYIFLQSKYCNIVKIEKDILKPIIKVSTLKDANELIKEYILFPYKKTNNKQVIISEIELKEKYPLAYQYLLDMKEYLDKRDNGKSNPIAWYAFGRTQSLNTSFGEKILFSPMNKTPNFIHHKNKNATFYSGYCIKYDGNYEKLLKQLNSERMEEYIKITSRDFRGGWKAYNKKIVQEFIIFDD